MSGGRVRATDVPRCAHCGLVVHEVGVYVVGWDVRPVTLCSRRCCAAWAVNAWQPTPAGGTAA